MALLVIHLWGKFWMAAWRGRRAMTWITGVIAFGASIVTAFTGYLSQQNFDSQWISTSAKDAFNSVGVGAFFNPMNFGQMFMWHIVLMPLLLVVIVGAHILLVRVRGVSHPLPQTRAKGRAARKAAAAQDARPWRGPTRRYDIIKEAAAATALVGTLTLRPGRPAVLAGHPGGHRAGLGPARPARVRQHRGHGTRRRQRDRRPTASRTTMPPGPSSSGRSAGRNSPASPSGSTPPRRS